MNPINSPVTLTLDYLIQEANHLKASDIHLNPDEKQYQILYRIHANLHVMHTLSLPEAQALISKIKLLANLNIAECRLPQEGLLTHEDHHQEVQCRISSYPTSRGEKVVLRLTKQNDLLSLKEIGLNPQQLHHVNDKLLKPDGLIVITGPTGSGKTKTLYAMLNAFTHLRRNIYSIEDPIEYTLSHVNQTQINPAIGLCEATLLKAVLRQDPDILMLGEIRDTVSAKIAIQAAQTGHLVLTSLHTRNIKETYHRLKSLHISLDQLQNTLSLVTAQRLVRLLCHHCKKWNDYSFSFDPVGCQHCHDGYQGRTGIFEINHLDRNHSSSPKETVSAYETLTTVCVDKIKQGITSYSELHRVIG